jgi:hypothetical protein
VESETSGGFGDCAVGRERKATGGRPRKEPAAAEGAGSGGGVAGRRMASGGRWVVGRGRASGGR